MCGLLTESIHFRIAKSATKSKPLQEKKQQLFSDFDDYEMQKFLRFRNLISSELRLDD